MRKSVSLVKVLFVILLIVIAVVVTMIVMDNRGEKVDEQNQLNNVTNNIENVTNNTVNIVNNEVTNEVTNTTVEDTQNNSSTGTVIKKAYPGGFAGAGMHEVQLNSNGEVYLVVYDGTGREQDNIISKSLVASDADDISENEQGGVNISGEKAKMLTDDYTWIKVMK